MAHKRLATAAAATDETSLDATSLTSRKRMRVADNESLDDGVIKKGSSNSISNGIEDADGSVQAVDSDNNHDNDEGEDMMSTSTRTLISVEPIIEPKVDYISDQGIETILPEPSPEERLAQVVRAFDFTQPIDAIRKAFNAQTKGLENTDDERTSTGASSSTASSSADAKTSSTSTTNDAQPPVDPRAALEPSFKYFHYALGEIEQLITLVKALQNRHELAQTIIPLHQLPAQQVQNDQIVALLAKKKHLRQAGERLNSTATRLRQQVEQKREQAEVLLALRRKWMMIRKVGTSNRPSRLAVDYGIVHDSIHRSKLVDLVKGEAEADDQTLKVAMPANMLNTGITVSCHRRAFDEPAQWSRMHVRPLASPPLAQGPRGIQQLLANAQFSLLCNIMHSELAREATLHHPSTLVKVSEREIVFSPGTEYSLSIKACSTKSTTSSSSSSSSSSSTVSSKTSTGDTTTPIKPSKPLNLTFERSAATTDSLVQLLCISLFRLFIAQSSASNAAYLHRLPAEILQSASAFDITYSASSDTIRTAVYPRVNLLQRLEELWAHYHFRASIGERLHQLRLLGKPVVALRWIHTGNPLISCAKIKTNMIGLPLQLTLHGTEAALGVSRQRLLSAKEVGDMMLHRMCMAILQELKAEAVALGFKPVVSFLAVSIPDVINGSTLKVSAVPHGDTSVHVEICEEGGSILGAGSISLRASSAGSINAHNINANRRLLNWTEIPGSCYRTKLLFLLSHTSKHSSIPLQWYLEYDGE